MFFFARNMDPGGTKKVEPGPVIDRCSTRYRRDYASLSATPDGFEPFAAAVGEMMRTQPDYTARDLAAIDAPVAIVQGDHDEFIRPEHAAYLARTMPVGTLTILPGVSHFAPRCSVPPGSTRPCRPFSTACRADIRHAADPVTARAVDAAGAARY